MQCLDAIYPALSPEVVIVENPLAPGTGVVLVRVEESIQAPHAIQNSTEIYVRRGDLSRPEEFASLAWIEHLLQRRSAPEAKRRFLHEAALARVMPTAVQIPMMTIAVIE